MLGSQEGHKYTDAAACPSLRAARPGEAKPVYWFAPVPMGYPALFFPVLASV